MEPGPYQVRYAWDRRRRALARTVAQYAPHVGVLDADTGREITADG